MSHIVRIPLPSPEDFDLAQTLDCGQAFRFAPLSDGRWRGVAGNHACIIGHEEDAIHIECACPGGCEGYWNAYFDAGRDYTAIKNMLAEDDVLARAVAYCPGMRLLRQDPWEALCSFIISQNNNIARIKGIIDRLCALCGEPLGNGAYAFPSPGAITQLDDAQLSVLRAGFRQKYIRDAAQKVAAGEIDLTAIAAAPLDEARTALMRIHGVGPKVAECALLFGFARIECFPQDVWIKRALKELYPLGFPKQYGSVAGLAQQYLFHYCRTSEGALSGV